MTYEEGVDRTFDNGHASCKSQKIELSMCAPCAEFLTQTLRAAGGLVGNDPKLRYYMKAFEADLIMQILSQVDCDLDAELGAIQ